MTETINSSADQTLNITVNDQPRTFPSPLTLAQLFGKIELASERGIAVAVNEVVVPKAEWPSHQILNNDSILIITATQGG